MHLFEINLKTNEDSTTLKESDYTLKGNYFSLPIETPFGILGNSIVITLLTPIVLMNLKQSIILL